MKLLLLNGHGINMRVDRAKLYIKDGRYSTGEEPLEYVFAPKRIDIDNVIIYGQDGNISIDAIRWLIKHNVAVSILNWDGKLLTIMLPPESVQVKTKFAQYSAYSDSILRLALAKKLMEVKFERTFKVLEWLKEKYPAISTVCEEVTKLATAETIPEIMAIESRVARFYWQQLALIFPQKFEFQSRYYQKAPWGAGDYINCLLNYGYAILESQCLKAINSAGLDAHVGFMHEMNVGKNSLAYDLQEPFRFLIDLAVINCIEKDIFVKKDFIRTENYNLKLRPSGAKKLIEEINIQFNNRTEYNGKDYTWHTILCQKTQELALYLLGKKRKIDFTQPKLSLERIDNEELRRKILNISVYRWKKRGYSKGSLYYLKKNAKSNKPFKLYKPIKKKIEVYCQTT